MISNSKKWHYLAVKDMSMLFIGVTSKYDAEIYCLNSFSFLEQKMHLKIMKTFAEIMIIVT